MNTITYVDEETYALMLAIESEVDKEQARLIQFLLATEPAGAPAEDVTIYGCIYCGCLASVGDVHCPSSRSPDGLHHHDELPF